MANKTSGKVIRFSAQVSSIKTTIDGGANVTLALSGKEFKALMQLLEVRQQVGVVLEVTAVPIISKPIEVETKQNDKKETPTKKRKQRFPYRD